MPQLIPGCTSHNPEVAGSNPARATREKTTPLPLTAAGDTREPARRLVRIAPSVIDVTRAARSRRAHAARAGGPHPDPAARVRDGAVPGLRTHVFRRTLRLVLHPPRADDGMAALV